MKNSVLYIIIRAVLILFFQIVVFKNIYFDSGSLFYLSVLIYPLIIFLLPHNINNHWILVIAFFIGLFVDMFYNSIGINAGALVLTAFLRPTILNLLEPISGYDAKEGLTIKRLGVGWMAAYFGSLLLIFLITYFSLSAFSFVYISKILLSTLFSFFASFFIIMLYVFTFNPKTN